MIPFPLPQRKKNTDLVWVHYRCGLHIQTNLFFSYTLKCTPQARVRMEFTCSQCRKRMVNVSSWSPSLDAFGPGKLGCHEGVSHVPWKMDALNLVWFLVYSTSPKISARTHSRFFWGIETGSGQTISRFQKSRSSSSIGGNHHSHDETGPSARYASCSTGSWMHAIHEQMSVD
jgi:hypothetical protein